MKENRRLTVVRRLWWPLLAWGFATVPPGTAAVRAEAPPDVERVHAESTKAPAKTATAEKDAERRRKRRTARAAGYVLLGTALIGALLIVWVIVWGRRLRHRGRKKKRTSTALDELWYLRPQANREEAQPEDDDGDTGEAMTNDQ